MSLNPIYPNLQIPKSFDENRKFRNFVLADNLPFSYIFALVGKGALGRVAVEHSSLDCRPVISEELNYTFQSSREQQDLSFVIIAFLTSPLTRCFHFVADDSWKSTKLLFSFDSLS